MLVAYNLDDYIATTEKGRVCTLAFYNLSLSGKWEVVRLLNEAGILMKDHRLYDRIIKGVLQHSSPEMRREYNVKGERKPRPEAMEADRLEALLALSVNFEAIEESIRELAEKMFPAIVVSLYGNPQ